MKTGLIPVVISLSLVGGLGMLGCDAPPPVIPNNAKQDLDYVDTGANDDVDLKDSQPAEDATSPADSGPTEDTLPLEDTPAVKDTFVEEDTAEADITSEPDVEEEDLSNVKITWKKDIEPISMDKCDFCHGKDGSHGLKLYTKQKWIDYFPMIIPALEKGSMPQGTSLDPGQLEDIILWGKVGYP